MKTIKQWERLKSAHQFIHLEKTGNPAAFAPKLHVSEREMFRLLECLKELGAIISFSRKPNAYRYQNDFELFVHISVKVKIEKELKTIYSGDQYNIID